MIVIDASALLEILLRTSGAKAVKQRLSIPQETLHAPHLLDVEVMHVFRRYSMAKELSQQRGLEAIADMNNLRLRRYPHDFLMPRVWELRHNLTAYDAIYVALAEALDAPLLTRDRRLANAAGHNAQIDLV